MAVTVAPRAAFSTGAATVPAQAANSVASRQATTGFSGRLNGLPPSLGTGTETSRTGPSTWQAGLPGAG